MSEKYLFNLNGLNICGKCSGLKNNGIESLPHTQIIQSLYLCNLIVLIFDISNLDYLIKQNL